MLSRRAVLAGGAALAASPIVAAQTSPAEAPVAGGAQPTVLKLERRDIEVNGKTASVFGIRQPDGAFACGSRTASIGRASSIGTG
jgi:hypothetical protein